ncbi:TPA: SEC-C domain-containing protein [Proteus mirabilis]|nr:SEC-C domain-containing protein [Proteus mirabilis]
MIIPSRNGLCPCGSGKKYKRCCLDHSSKKHAAVLDEISQILAMNPTLTLDELNLVAEHKITRINHQPLDDFCGLSPAQMSNWLYAPLDQLSNVNLHIPNDLNHSPVLRYLALILDYAVQQGGSFKTTTRGNLPSNLVKQANELLTELPISKFNRLRCLNEFEGSNEGKFNALHYTRILAELAGILISKKSRFEITPYTQQQYRNEGIRAFFFPMLTAATTQFNWGYFDSFDEHVDLRQFWLFMTWRLHAHASIDKLIDEVCIAFPDLLTQFSQQDYFTPREQLTLCIKSRFLSRFLEFWGFITFEQTGLLTTKPLFKQPMFQQTFDFLL